MAGFRWIKSPAFLLLAFRLIAAVSEHHSPSFVIRDGAKASLPCQSVKNAQHKCDSSDWLFSSPGSSNTATIVHHGHVQENTDRLSVTANCSLVIEKVTAEDVGFYTCRRFKSWSGQDYDDASVYVFLVNITKHDENQQRLKLSCSVRADQRRQITLKWLYDGKNVDEDNTVKQEEEVKTWGTGSTVTVTFPARLKQFNELFKCYVRDEYTQKVSLFTFSHPSPDATTTQTTKPATTRAGDKKSRIILTGAGTTKHPSLGWWLLVVVGSAVFVTVVAVVVLVVVIRYKGNKGEKVQVDDSAADPEDVSYASVSYTKKSKALVPVHDEGDTVTYSTVKASSSSDGVCADPSVLYATINKAVR